MNWARKQELANIDKRIVKPKKPILVAVNSVDPKKEFVILPILLDWHTDSVPCMLILSPHERFDEVLYAYYNGIRRNIHGYAWHVDNVKVLDEMQTLKRSELPCHKLHCFAFDPDRTTMSALMQRIPFFHKVAEHRFKEDLAVYERNRRDERAYHNSRGNPIYWLPNGFDATTTWTTTYGTATNVTIGSTRWTTSTA
jgi:hypothetical protein